ncbi:hypothetical protein [Streptomyces sp. CBMA156]|uniref:hypothetical protein n=1 Tax=Streptomyces sp. CBMA156 TaxID=1930280 RepID=UPI001661AD7B|nr:hypothetical protein [Streptomyces sp. CBMA156]MBD0670399.1 hypothetical protein [Streptomyces sp. CBMA156]
MPLTDITARTAGAPTTATLPTGRPGCLVIALLDSHTRTATGTTRTVPGVQCTTSYPDGSWVCVRLGTAGSQALAELAAALLPEGAAVAGFLSIDGHLVAAKERRTAWWAVRAAEQHGRTFVTLTPSRAPGIPRVRVIRFTDVAVTGTSGDLS